MKSIKKATWILLAGMMVGWLGTQAHAETVLGDYFKEQGVELEVSAATDFYNQYIWRGFKLDSDPVIQPSVTISVGGFEGGFWGSWDVDEDDGEGVNSDEVDGWIGYSHDLGFLSEELAKVTVSAGHTWYAFPGNDTYTKEFYVGVSLDTFLSPYFTWYHDYDEEAHGGADGDYFLVGIGHSFVLDENYGITLDLGQEIGFNSEAFIVGSGGYSLTSLGLTVPMTDNLTIAPSIAYSSPFGDLADEADGNQDDEFYAGVSMAYSM